MSASTLRTPGKTPKLQQICAQLSDMAHELGPDAKMPTAIQLRDATGVSMATLNTALGELEKQHIIIRKHGVGIFVASELHLKKIALICNSSFFHQNTPTPFHKFLFEAARRRAQSHGETIELHFSQLQSSDATQLQRGLAHDIRAGRVQGVLGIELDDSTAHFLAKQQVPFVSLFGPTFGPCGVSFNYNSSCFIPMGAQALAQRGCKSVALWGLGGVVNTSGELDFELMRSNCAAYKVHFDRDNSRFSVDERFADWSSQRMGREWALQLLEKPRDQWPDGLVITEDIITNAALLAFQNAGVVVGRDIHIVTHANEGSHVLRGHNGQFDLLEYNLSELVEQIFSALESLMTGEKPAQHFIFVVPHLRTSETWQR